MEDSADNNSESERNLEIASAPATASGSSSTEHFQRRKRKKKDHLDEKIISFLEESKTMEHDDDRAFLVSLLPTLKTFNEVEKLQFRSEVMRIMMEIKNIPLVDQHRTQANLLQPRNVLASQTCPSFLTNSTSFAGLQHDYQDAPIQTMLRPQSSYTYYSDQSSRHSFSYSSAPSPIASPSSETNSLPTLAQLTGTDVDESYSKNE